MYVKSGTQNRTNYVKVADVVHMFGKDLCECLPGLHAFTGCDSVSSFAGKGKIAPLKMVKKYKKFQTLFKHLGMEWQLTDEDFTLLQEFTCLLYSATSGTSEVNELRYRLFCTRKGELDSNQLPPCADSLKLHSARANYQAAIWRRCLEACPVVPSPVGHGWLQEEDSLTIKWMCGDPAPIAVLEFLACSCSRVCKLPNCSCLANGLKCTDMCRLKECSNRKQEEEEEEEVIEADDNDLSSGAEDED